MIFINKSFEDFCTLRTVCKKWNTFVPLVMYEAVISKLNSGLKFGLTNHHTAELSKKLLPTYCDSTKTFTFLFDQTENTDILEILNMDPYNIEKFDAHAMDFIAFIKKDEDVKWVDNIGTKRVDKIGIKFTGYFSPEFINGDIRKYQFDRKSNICLNQEAKVYDNGSGINYPVLYSFTIAAWKLCYILDCFALNRSKIRKGFHYFPLHEYDLEVNVSWSLVLHAED